MQTRSDVIKALEVLGSALHESGLYITSHKDNEFMVCVKCSKTDRVIYENSILAGTLGTLSQAFGDSIDLKGIK